MNFKINFSVLLVTALFAISCNSSKKNVENGDGKDYSNFSRVGSVDTMQDALVLPGNVKSTDAYINTVMKGMNNVMRETTKDGVKYSYILGGKSTFLIKTTVNAMGDPSNSTDIFRKDGKLIYAFSKEVKGTDVQLHKYYFDNDVIVNHLLGTMQPGDDNSRGQITYKNMAIPAGKDTEIKNLETSIQNNLVNISPFVGRVSKKGTKYTMTTCFNDKEYSLSDENGFLVKSFSDNKVGEEGFLMMTIKGLKDDVKKVIVVQGIDSAFPNAGSMNCF